MRHYERKTKTGYTFNVEVYESAFELANTNQRRGITEQWKNDCLEESEIHKSWHGVRSRDEAYSLLKSGWSEHINEIGGKLDNVSVSGMQKKISFQNDVVGFAPVVPLAMMNVPNSMINTAIRNIKQKVVKIVYHGGNSAGSDPEEFIEKGKVLLETITMLERSGYRCELYMAWFFCKSERSDSLMVKVKEANQPLDIKRIMFPMCHPAMFRVIGFEWQDRLPTGKYMDGRGVPFHCVYHNEEKFKEAFGNEYIYIDAKIIDKGREEIEKRLTGRK